MPDEIIDSPDDSSEGEDSLRSALEASFAEAESSESSQPSVDAQAERRADTTAPRTSAPETAPTPANNLPPERSSPLATPAAPTETVPQRLQAKWADKWNTLAPEVKSEFLQYESHIGRLASRYGQQAAAWEKVEQQMAPYAQLIRQDGGDFHGVIGGMLETARVLRQGTTDQKLAVMHFLIRQHGIPARIDPSGVIQIPTPQTSPEILNRLSALEHQDLTMRAASTHNVQHEVRSEIDSFLADPTKPYAQEPGFLDIMADIIRTGRASDLNSAYTQAAWLHDATRPLEIAKANQAALAPQLNQARQARSAAVSVNGNSPGAVTPDVSKMSLRETLSAAYDGELT